jgi:hypothetical protein
MVDYKEYAVPAIFTAATLLFIAACATPVVEFGTSSYFTFFEACFTIFGIKVCINENYVTCAELDKLRKATAAFLILSTICTGATGILSGVRKLFPVFNQQPYKLAVLGGAGVSALFGAIAFALAFVVYAGEFCGITLSKQTGQTIGASPICALIGWLVTVGGGVAEFLFNKPLENGPNSTTQQTTSSIEQQRY